MAAQEFVSGSGWVSSDSSMYGDEDEQTRLLSLNDDFNADSFWSVQNKDMNAIAAASRDIPAPKLVNRREGHHDAWQLEESVDDFVKRLPPLTTSCSTCDWIWVDNPYPEGHAKSSNSQLGDFLERGSELLEQSRQTRTEIQHRSDKRGMSKMLNDESKLLEQRITDLAVETNILSGKWMLFPPLEDVTRIWKLIVDGVINNRLGPTAKVAPDEGKEGERLICVYTKDFRDEEDVLRVLRELVAMGLAGSGRSIYYKSDPYTYLNIYRETAAEYGLRASIYSSQTMKSVQGRQSKINGFFK